MARRRLPILVATRVTPTERAMIDVAAASAGVNVTTLLRRLVLPAVRAEVERAAAGLEQELAAVPAGGSLSGGE